jgi:UDP-N-acetylmuramoyl-tripeptide--D-alanyl-D-alanine ligase
MKTVFKKLVLASLKRLAKRRMKRFKGKVVAVTGSAGKTTTKDAIFCVLNSQYRVKKTEKSMNSEFGLLLTILDIESGFSSATKWSWYLLKGFAHSCFRDHNEILLLEYGVDKPGDMDFLVSVAPPDYTVLTNVSETHLDKGQFKDVDAVFEEKSKLVAAVKDGGKAILNYDNSFTLKLAKKRKKSETITYGGDNAADVWASRIKQSLDGMSFLLHHKEARYSVETKVVGEQHISALLAALAVGFAIGVDEEKAVTAVGRCILPPGRLSVIDGVRDSIILDSSYNSSPAALSACLKTLKELGAEKRKIAVIGNMNELGDHSRALHKEIGAQVPRYADILVSVGRDAAILADEAIKKGFEEKNVYKFKNANEAAEAFEQKIKKNDLILVKGSQNNVRLERFVKAIMARPQEAKSLLVRQERVWQAKL